MHDQQGARNLYLNTDFTQKEIAEKLGIDPKTIYLWIKKGKWDEMKAAARQAPGIIQQQLYNHITAINDSIADRDDHVPTFQEVEMLRKLIVSTKHMQQMSLGTYVQAFQELTSFIGPHTNDLEFTKRVAIVADEYIKGLVHNKHFHIEKKVRDTTDAIKETDNDEADHVNPSDQGDNGSDTASPQVCHPVDSNLQNNERSSTSYVSTTHYCQPMSPFRGGVEPTDEPAQEPHSTSLFLGEPARTTFQSGGSRGEASPTGHESGIPEKQETTATPSLSNPSPETPASKIPDSVAMTDREITAEDKEKHAREVEQIITRQDYIKYEYLLETKTENPDETVYFNGVEVNLMTIQYNLKQFEEPEWRRNFRSREEVIAAFLASMLRRK